MGRVRRRRRSRNDQPADARARDCRRRLDLLGKVFALNLSINIPDPPLFTRGKHSHTVKIFPNAEFVLDDYLDNFYPQASSQWDALAHVKHPVHGAYNGIPDNQITGRGGMRLGIDNLARRGIAGRGVLADVARYYDRIGKSINFTSAESIPLGDVQATLEDEGVALRAGDVLLIRIGWTKFYLSASAEIKAELARETIGAGNRRQRAHRAMAVGQSSGGGRVGFASA